MAISLQKKSEKKNIWYLLKTYFPLILYKGNVRNKRKYIFFAITLW